MSDEKAKHTSQDTEKNLNTTSSNLISYTSYRRVTIYAAVVALILLSWIGVIDKKTEGYINETLVTAVASFASARAINSAVSVIKSGEVSLLGISVDIGAALDPVDDMVEDFSTVMKFATASLIIQKIAIEIVSSNGFKILLTVGGTLFMVVLKYGSPTTTNLFFKIFLTAGLVRFLLIFVLAGSSLADSAFLEQQTAEEVKNLKAQSNQFNSAESELGLSQEKKASLNHKLKSTSAAMTENQAQLDKLNREFQAAQDNRAAAEERLALVKEGRSAIDSINFLKKDAGYDAAIDELEAAENKEQHLLNKIETLTDTLAELTEQRQSIQATLNGEDKSFLDSMSTKIASIKDSLSLDEINQVAKEFVDTSIRLISLFVLKTIVFPLLFLYIGIKGFQAIWRINPTELLREKIDEGKTYLKEQRRQQETEV